MDLAQNKIFDIYERLFAEEGWKELVDDLKEKLAMQNTNLVNIASSERDLYKAKGINFAWGYIINLEENLAKAKKLADEEQLNG